jgi:hypothetical protein
MTTMIDALLLAAMALSLAAMAWLLKSGFRPPAPPPSAPDRRRDRHAYTPPAPPAPATHWSDGGRLQTEVVAESRYADTVRELAGQHGDNGADTRLPAVLVVDQANPYDDKPVAVFIEGRMVGYLAPRDAQAFREQQARQDITGQAVSCDAAIRGGKLWNGKRLAYAIWLDIEPQR